MSSLAEYSRKALHSSRDSNMTSVGGRSIATLPLNEERPDLSDEQKSTIRAIFQGWAAYQGLA